MNKAQQRMLESRTLDLAEEVDGLKVANATLTARVAELEAIVGPLVAADDMWTDYGNGFRIHFGFSADASDEMNVVSRLNSARATLNKANQHDKAEANTD